MLVSDTGCCAQKMMKHSKKTGCAPNRTHPAKSHIRQKLQCHYNTGVFGGRGWITQAAHLKRPRRGLFAAGTYGGGPYELRLPIFLQPLGGALKNRSAAPASPPCFRRRRRSAPLLFESTRPVSLALQQNKNLSVLSYVEVFWWARVDYASRAAKNSPLGCFCAVFSDVAAAVRIHP